MSCVIRRLVPVLIASLAAPVTLLAQGVPQGPEFRVNTYTTNSQTNAAVVSSSTGDFVVVWQSSDGTSPDVFGQRYSSGGTPLGGEFRVNSFTTGLQAYPSVASDPAGNFVVVWHSSGQDGNQYGVFAQRFSSTGVPQGGEFRVNTFTTLDQDFPSVAVDSSGNFVVAWDSGDGSAYGVFGQRFASTGAPLGAEFRINTYTPAFQGFPSVASDSAGNFVVAWISAYQDGSYYGVFARRFASTGTPLGGEFRVNTYTTATQTFPSVASGTAGNFVVAWHSSNNQDGEFYGVFAQRFSSAGAPLGAEFRVNTYTTESQVFPAVASDSSGNFVVSWHSNYQDGSSTGVFGQRYASTGTPLGAEFRVNTYTTNSQRVPAIGSDAAGNFVVVWQSYDQDGSLNGIYAQRYSPILPVELQTFVVE